MPINPWDSFEEKPEGDIPTASLQIYQFIGEYLKREKDTNVNRASAATMCVKRRWYQHQGWEGTPLTPRKMINFMLGDLTERVMLYFIKNALVGPGKLYSKVDFGDVIGTIKFQGKDIDIYSQKTISFKLSDGTPITCHLDGIGYRNSDDCPEIIEIKSAADYGFESFKEDGPGDYIKQMHAAFLTDECKQKNITSGRYFYLKKNTGHVYDRIVYFNDEIAALVLREFMVAKGKTEPLAPHPLVKETYYRRPTGRTIAGFPCSYCPYIRPCKGPHEKEFKNGSVKFVFKEKEKELAI